VGKLAGDPLEYELIALSILRGEGFSHYMFGLRPPLFPLFVAGTYAMGGAYPSLAIFFQMVWGALAAVLVYKLGYRLVRRHGLAATASVLLFSDLSFPYNAVTLFSEPLHNFLLLCAMFWIAVFVQHERWSALLAAGVSLCLMLLTRTSGVYFVALLILTLLVYRPRLWQHIAALGILIALPVMGWSYRNYVYTDNFSMGTNSTFTILFYKVVSVESHASGRSPDEVAIDIGMELEHRLGNTHVTREEIAEYPVGRSEDRYSNDPARQAISKQIIRERLVAYPGWTVIMTVVSLVRQFDPIEGFLLPAVLQRIITVTYLGFAAVGVWRAIRERRWLLLVITLPVIVYFAGTTAFALSGLYDTRFRTTYMPVVMILTVYGIDFVLRRYRLLPQAGVVAGLPQ
jgi:4-amino-4-deoxy-L-arabinose transferase-like glycosyltransferase